MSNTNCKRNPTPYYSGVLITNHYAARPQFSGAVGIANTFYTFVGNDIHFEDMKSSGAYQLYSIRQAETEYLALLQKR